MKRASIVPTPRSYTTFFSSVNAESVTSFTLSRIKTIYAQWLKRCEEDSLTGLRQERPENLSDDGRLSEIPTNAYLTLLSRLDKPDLQGMLEAYDSMPRNGALAPSKETVTILLYALVRHVSEQSDNANLAEIHVHIARVWQRCEEAFHAGRFELDARAVSPMLRYWTLPLPSGAGIAKKETIQSISRLFGLDENAPIFHEAHSEQQASSTARYVALDPDSLFSILQMAATWKDRELFRAWFKQTSEGHLSGGTKPLLEARHCQLAMAVSPAKAEGEHCICKVRYSQFP